MSQQRPQRRTFSVTWRDPGEGAAQGVRWNRVEVQYAI